MVALGSNSANTLGAAGVSIVGMLVLERVNYQSRKERESMNEPTNLLRAAEQILNKWLVDNTDGPFEEEPEIDAARTLILDAIEHMESSKCHS